MAHIKLSSPRVLILFPVTLLMLFAVACGSSSPAEPVVVEKEVIKEVIKEVPVEKEVIKEVRKEVIVEKQVIKEVEKQVIVLATGVPLEVIKPLQQRVDNVSIMFGSFPYDSNYSYKVIISGYPDKRPVLEFLAGIDQATGAYRPELATSWSLAENGKDWTFKLRKGIQFHQGWGEFTAKDVAHSAWLLVSPKSTASGLSGWRQYWGVEKGEDPASVAAKLKERVEIVNDYEVIIHIQTAFPESMYQLSRRRNMPMESKARWDAVGGDERYGDTMVGTGPMKFVERVEGSHVSYESMDQHWRVVPQFKNFQLQHSAEPSTRLAALLTDNVQIADLDRELRPDAISRGMKMVSGTVGEVFHHWGFYGNYHSTPDKLDPTNPLLDVKVRQAMAKAVNRRAIGAALMPGETLVYEGYHPFDEMSENTWPGVTNPKWAEDFDEVYGYDPEAAKKLLAESGFANGFEFNIAIYSASGLPLTGDIGQAIALDFEAIGLRPNLQQIEFSKIRGQRRKRELHNTIIPTAVGGGFSLYSLKTRFDSKGGTVREFEHPKLDVLWDEMIVTLDKKRRTELQREMGNICFYELICRIPMFVLRPSIAINPKYISNYVYPGILNGNYSAFEYIETVPR